MSIVMTPLGELVRILWPEYGVPDELRSDHRKPQDGDVVCRYRGREESALFRAYRADDTEKVSLILRPNDPVTCPPEILTAYLNLPASQRRLWRECYNGSALGHFNPSLLRSFVIPILTDTNRKEKLLTLLSNIDHVKRLQEESRRTLAELVKAVTSEYLTPKE